MKKQSEVKEKIIQAATGLISESEGNVADISTRAIAERAGVGIGLINYHFQTKDHLIEICVERIIENEISSFRPEIPATGQSPVKKLKIIAQQVADFLTANPAVSRISILSDHRNPQLTDNTMKSVMGAKSVINDLSLPVEKQTLLAFVLISAMQALFLRKDQSRDLFGYDINIKKERDEVLDLVIEALFENVTDAGVNEPKKVLPRGNEQ